jgi:sensor c-di-GMP phosphodiesterase-like protein
VPFEKNSAFVSDRLYNHLDNRVISKNIFVSFFRDFPSSLRALTALTALAIALPIFALLWVTYNQTRDRVAYGLTLIANASVARGDTVLMNTESALKKLVDQGNTGCSDVDRAAYGKAVYEKIEIRGINVLDRGQRLYECNDLTVHNPPITVKTESSLLIGKPGEIAIVPPRLDVQSQLSIFINFGHGNNKILGASIYPEQFWDFQDALGLGDGGAVILLDDKGNELTALRKSEKSAPTTLAQRNATGLHHGDSMFSVTARSEKFPIAAVAVISEDTVMANWRRSLQTFAPLALLLAALTSTAIWRYGLRNRSLSEDLRDAIAKNDLSLVYQPIVDVNTGQTKTVEVLCRWKHKTKGDISPEMFIPEAARSGLLPSLSAWVFTQSANEMRPLIAKRPQLRVSINVGRDDLVANGPLSLAMKQLPQMQKHFTVEITERDSLAEMLDSASAVLNDWRSAGVKVALDDFGTGCCNLSYLRALPIDVVKIDRMFSAPLDDASGSNDAEMFDAMLSLLLYRKLDIIVEGVEREAQHQALRSRKVNYAQGWFYARPMEISALSAWLEKRELDARNVA